MGGHIDFGNFVAARVYLKKCFAAGIGLHGVQEIPVDLPDLVGDPLDGGAVGNIFLDNFEAGPGVVLKPCLADLAGPQGDGLLTDGADEWLRN